MLIYNENFYPNDIFSRLDFSRIKGQLKSIFKNKLSDCGSICIIEEENYTIGLSNTGEINVYYDLEHGDTIQDIINEIENLFKLQIGNFSIFKSEEYITNYQL
ncbi:TPA: hypothetical protein PPO51_002468 [Clostridioides difficile]|nr:hypothetical protein [Clostridioides difficile]HDJ1470944.1 hypothetical protein [Clostridioides difficile]